jgi:hypothetical protein
MQFLVTALERYYPEFLAGVLIYNAPWVFQPFWRMIRPWLDENVASKVRARAWTWHMSAVCDKSRYNVCVCVCAYVCVFVPMSLCA